MFYLIAIWSPKHFHIQMKQIDSLNYFVRVSLWDTPARNVLGFFEDNDDSFFWFSNDFPPPSGIISETRSKRKFSWMEDPYVSEVPLWDFIYSTETGLFEKTKSNDKLFE
jgi:hypothetical protein